MGCCVQVRGGRGRDTAAIVGDNAAIVCHCDTLISQCYIRNKILIDSQAADSFQTPVVTAPNKLYKRI